MSGHRVGGRHPDSRSVVHPTICSLTGISIYPPLCSQLVYFIYGQIVGPLVSCNSKRLTRAQCFDAKSVLGSLLIPFAQKFIVAFYSRNASGLLSPEGFIQTNPNTAEVSVYQPSYSRLSETVQCESLEDYTSEMDSTV